MIEIPFTTINWASVDKVEYRGETGTSFWQTIQYPGLRIRLVEYSENYLADHWCTKGHIVYCLKGSFTTELKDGNSFTLSEGMSYIVSDELSSHRSATEKGATLLIVDGEFLKLPQ